MMKKKLLVTNLGWGSYRGAVSFMYGISKASNVAVQRRGGSPVRYNRLFS